MGEPLIKLSTPQGMELKNEACAGVSGSVFQPTMWNVFGKQTGNSCCGIQSCVMILNAGFLNRQGQGGEIEGGGVVLEDLSFSEKNMFEFPQTLTVTNYKRVQSEGKGCNLNEVADILKAHGCSVHKFNISAELEVNEFRSILSSALGSSAKGIVANYFMNAIEPSYPLYGHHSPIGGFHAKTDRFLVLDVWPETEVGWVKTQVLYDAMNTVDEETGTTRGFVVVGTGTGSGSKS